jgi:hypothetical protein
MVSPTFPKMLGLTSQQHKHGDSLVAAQSEALPVVGIITSMTLLIPALVAPALVAMTEINRASGSSSQATHVDASETPYNTTKGDSHRNARLPNMQVHDSLNDQAGSIISAAWAEVSKSSSSEQSKQGSLRCQRGGRCETDGSSSDSRSSNIDPCCLGPSKD